MKRQEIMDNCPAGYEAEMTAILDHFEQKFNAIRDYLDVDDLECLDVHEMESIIKACIIAYTTGIDIH